MKHFVFTTYIILMVFIGFFFINEYNKINEDRALLNLAKRNFDLGFDEVGFEQCSRMNYRKGICYASYMSIELIQNNGTIQPGICDRIPIVDDEPWWESTDYVENIKAVKQQCLDAFQIVDPIIDTAIDPIQNSTIETNSSINNTIEE